MKNKNNHQKEEYSFPYSQEITKFKKKYKKFLPFLKEEEIQNFFEEAVRQYQPDMGIGEELAASFKTETLLLLQLKKLILEEDNLDVEIVIIDAYLPIAKMLLNKLKYQGEDENNIAEKGIINAIENYDGEVGMKIAIFNSLKNSIQHSEEVKEKKEEDKKRPPTSLDKLLHDIDILHNSPIEDAQYVRFLSLKYGYQDEQYFSLEEIATNLSISHELVADYYKQSLKYVKDWFGYQLDQLKTYQIKASD